jgi:hypothetical protein
MADDELLAELRRITGWRHWHDDLDALAQRAAEAGVLQFACDAAKGRWWNSMGISSNSSATAVVFGPDGRVEDVQAFLLLLRQELLSVLNDVGGVR